MLRVDLLGPMRVTVRRPDTPHTFDDQAIDLTPTGPRERVALAMLTLASPHAVSAASLAEEMYGDDQPSDPRNAVQAIISRLRKALGAEAHRVETIPAGYRLREVETDVAQAESALASPTTLVEGLALWRGEALGDLNPGPAISSYQVRLEELYLAGQESVLETQIGSGHHTDAVPQLEAAVRERPLRERRWEQLMLALYRSGRQADALRAFQRARSILSTQLGLEPGRKLVELEEQILRHDPALDLDPAVITNRATPDGTRLDPGSTPVSALDQAVAANRPRGTVTFLISDVEGSVKAWEEAPTATAEQIDAMHQLWTETIARHDGNLVKSTGDGVLAVFATASNALAAASDAQGAFRTVDRSEDGNLVQRVSIHTGEAQPVDGDYRGQTVNRCARLADLAYGDQILVSNTTAELATMPSVEHDLRSLGTHWLRDVKEPVAVFQLVGPGLRSAFPPLRSVGPANLPRLRSELVGRDDIVDEIADAVDNEPLVTLVGTGGIGKTSAALAVGWKVSPNRSVCFVDLAGVDNPDLVEARVAETLLPGSAEGDRTPIDRIVDRLRVSTDLVIIDNAEHLLAATAAMADQVLAQDLKGSLLVTSRTPMNLKGELVIIVDPLALPDADADLADTAKSPSIRLFVDRMEATQPGSTIPEGLLPVVAHICRRLDGIPLAIELAASRVGILPVPDIASRLDDQLRLLRLVPAQANARHASLEAVAKWSVEQLGSQARRLFGQLSIITGSFDMAGAEAIIALADGRDADVLDAIAELVAASLLVTEPGNSGRFRMLEPIRQLAETELLQTGSSDDVRWAQVTWLAQRSIAAHRLRDRTRVAHYAALDADEHQLRSAVQWSVNQLHNPPLGRSGTNEDSKRLQTIVDLALGSAWWFVQHDPVAGIPMMNDLVSRIDRDRNPLQWARAVVALGLCSATLPVRDMEANALDAIAILDEHDDPDRTVARLTAAQAHTISSIFETPLRLIEEAEELLDDNDEWLQAALDMLAMGYQTVVLMVAPDDSDLDTAASRGERAVNFFRDAGDNWSLGATLGELGRVYSAGQELDKAEACFVEALELFDGIHFHGRHYVLTELGLLSSARSDFAAAKAYHREAIDFATNDGNIGCLVHAKAGMAQSEAAAGNIPAAVSWYREAIADSDSPAGQAVNYGSEMWRDELTRLEALLEK